ncbi:MAG TPA: ATP-dependent 6-phosphofructokinase [Polyangiales bacterium]|nr:ATP-dependent 6-phosphofructokinase [Polyangiales bacterium]
MRKASDPKAEHAGEPEDAPRRVCVLTGGGDAPGLNAVVRAFVKTGSELGLEILGSEDGFEGLIRGDRIVKLKPSSVRGILPRGGSILGCSNRANPFAYPGRDPQGKEIYTDESDRVLQHIADHRIDALVMVGGDGTMTHARELEKRGVHVVGVPKTIDNDLAATDFTFGFDTAVGTATWAIDALHSTAESHDRVMLIELMGRYAGWIALHAGIAGGADVILLPEIPYDVERVVAKIQRRAEAGASFSLVVVGEGARPKDGQLATISEGAKGHLARLGGAAHQLQQLLHGRLAHEIRVTVLGHLQRGGSPSAFDRLLGTRFGVAAATLCATGQWGRMVALRGQDVTHVPIADAVDHPKLVPVDGELVHTARAIGIELGD